MPRKQAGKQILYFMVFVSLFSFFLTIVIILFPPEIQDDFQWRRQSAGLLFISICILGMISVFFPKQCSMIFHENAKKTSTDVSVREKEGFQKSSKILGVVLTHGHHPECKGFFHHELKVGKKTFCIACMGLFFGAVMAIFGALSYFFFEWLVGLDGLFLVVFGIIGVALCLMHYTLFDLHSGLIRFSLNVFFVFGMFLIVAGIDSTVQNSALNLFFAGLSIFWLFTRILLSKNKHKEICQTCNLDCNFRK